MLRIFGHFIPVPAILLGGAEVLLVASALYFVAPIVPGLNSNEIPSVIKAAADRGALSAGFTIVRLNGSIAEIFTDWIHKAFPDRAEKVLNMIRSCHDGNLNDSEFGRRMSGEGKIAESIHQMFKMACNRFLADKDMPPFNYDLFVPKKGKQTTLF